MGDRRPQTRWFCRQDQALVDDASMPAVVEHLMFDDGLGFKWTRLGLLTPTFSDDRSSVADRAQGFENVLRLLLRLF